MICKVFTSEKLKNRGMEPAKKDPTNITNTKHNNMEVSSIFTEYIFYVTTSY